MRVRQGNDFIFLWAIERNGEPEDLSNAVNIKLHFKNFDRVSEVKSFQIVDGNIVRVEVSPEWASRLGAYSLILSYAFEDESLADNDRKCVVDVLAFNIVSKTSEADDVSEMAKTTDIMIGLQGLSAYEVWLKDNPESTKEDYYNWLRQPATDIAETVGLQEQARVEAENTRKNNEEQRVTAETNRQNNFNSFIEVSESAVNTFIGTAQSDINEAISNAETATENANTAATNADNARLAIQDDLALKANQTDLAQLESDVKGTTEKPTAQSLSELNARITALEAIISNKIKDRIEVTKEFNVWGKTNLILYGTGANTKAPDFIGQKYIDTAGGNVYVAVGTSNAGNWKLV